MANTARSKPRTRKEQREQTHARFIEATLQLLEEGGPGALSVSELGRRLGVHHSLFYAHFKDLDAVLAAAASQVIATVGPIDRELRRQMLQRSVTDRHDLTHYFEGAFVRWLEHRSVVRLLLAHRSERSAMGEALREALGAMREEIRGELEDVAGQMGISGPSSDELFALADLHLSHFLWALEGIIDGPSPGQATSASMLADLFIATNMVFFRRMIAPARDTLLGQAFSPQERESLDKVLAAYRVLLEQPLDQIIAALGQGSAGQAIAQVMSLLPRFFIRRLAQAPVMVLQRITYGGETYSWTMLASHEGLSVRPASETDLPRLTITMPFRAFLETTAAVRHFDGALRGGEVVIEGDVLFGVEFMEWFYLPPATPPATPGGKEL